jgi:hypothetical protein
MIQDAMRGWIEVSLEDGDPIPEPRLLEDYSGKFVVRLPRSLHRDLVEMASQEGVSLNQYVNVALGRSVGRVSSTHLAVSEELGWPGLKAAVQQVLATAGFAQEAGELDERLFANWVEQCLSQVESALQGRYLQDALGYLEILAQGLRVGINKSPVMRVFYQTVSLLHQQVDMSAQIQRGVMSDLVIRSRILQAVQGTNRPLAERVIQEERVAYSEISTERTVPLEFIEQRLERSRRAPQW